MIFLQEEKEILFYLILLRGKRGERGERDEEKERLILSLLHRCLSLVFFSFLFFFFLFLSFFFIFRSLFSSFISRSFSQLFLYLFSSLLYLHLFSISSPSLLSNLSLSLSLSSHPPSKNKTGATVLFGSDGFLKEEIPGPKFVEQNLIYAWPFSLFRMSLRNHPDWSSFLTKFQTFFQDV